MVEIRKKTWQNLQVKDRMKFKNQNKRRQFERKQIYLTDLKNFKKYFDYSGGWKGGAKRKELLWKRDEREVFEVFNLEQRLNSNRSFNFREDRIRLARLGHRRYEVLDAGTLKYAAPSETLTRENRPTPLHLLSGETPAREVRARVLPLLQGVGAFPLQKLWAVEKRLSANGEPGPRRGRFWALAGNRQKHGLCVRGGRGRGRPPRTEEQTQVFCLREEGPCQLLLLAGQNGLRRDFQERF